MSEDAQIILGAIGFIVVVVFLVLWLRRGDRPMRTGGYSDGYNDGIRDMAIADVIIELLFGWWR